MEYLELMPLENVDLKTTHVRKLPLETAKDWLERIYHIVLSDSDEADDDLEEDDFDDEDEFDDDFDDADDFDDDEDEFDEEEDDDYDYEEDVDYDDFDE